MNSSDDPLFDDLETLLSGQGVGAGADGLDVSLDLLGAVAEILRTLHLGRDDLHRRLVELVAAFLDAEGVALYLERGGALGSTSTFYLTWSRGGRRGHAFPPSLDAADLEGQAREGAPGLIPLWDGEAPLGPDAERRAGIPPPTLIGALRLYDAAGRDLALAPDRRDLFGRLVVAALRGARLYREATTDGLTGLFTRRHFDTLFQQELIRAARSDAPLALVMLDLDHFKQINDTYGHLAGDRVLAAFGSTLRSTLRQTDVAARYGGEEFALLLPGTNLEGAHRLGEKIRAAALQVPVPRGAMPLTVSAGVAAFDQGAPTAETLVRNADRALYEAKTSGRNRVVVFDPDRLEATPRTDPLAGVLTGDAARDHRNVSLLLRVNHSFTRTASVDDLLAVVVDAALEITDAERGIIMLLDEPREELRRSLCRGLLPRSQPQGLSVNLEAGELRVRHRLARGRGGVTLPWIEGFSRSIPRRVLSGAGPLRFERVEGDLDQDALPASMHDLRLRKVLCAPLDVGGTTLGVLYVDSHLLSSRFSDADFAFFQALASHAAVTLYHATLLETLSEAHRELQQLDRLKSDFLAIASHELKTPLTALMGYVHLLRGQPLDELPQMIKKGIQVIDRETHRLVARVHDILNLSRVGMDHIPLRPQVFDLSQLLVEAAAEVRPFAQQRRIDLTLTLPEEGSWRVEAEPEALRTVLQNLLQNAIRFTPDGGRVDLALRGLDDEIEVRVTDTGIGIPPAYHERVFERFFVLEDVNHHSSGTFEFRSGGMGIGLSIARGIIQTHGGTMGVESEPGTGSTFWFRIPRRAARHEGGP